MKARLDFHRDARIARITLAAPKANVLDRSMITDLESIFEQLENNRDIRAIVLEGEGAHFSFGASVEEHLPEQIEAALARLGSLLRKVAAAPAPTIAAIRGLCLGGGLELALACDLIVAEETAELGLPEIKLGVFPPAASALLPVRIGTAGAASLILTGKSWNGRQAYERGLVALAPAQGTLEEALTAYLEENFLGRSAAALHYAARAVRRSVVHALYEDLPKLDRLYLNELMNESDPVEGIRAFMERREPKWGRREQPL